MRETAAAAAAQENQVSPDVRARFVGSYAQTGNMRLALDTMFALINAPPGMPRMATFSGPSGYGKSVACGYVAAVTNSIYIEANAVWTGKTFLEKLAQELGIPLLRKTAAGVLDDIIRAFSESPCALIIDEMDHLVTKKCAEMIRAIHDGTGIPVLLVGEEALPAKLQEWERFHNRLLISTLAAPASIEDGRLLRDLYCGTINVADDLVDHFTMRCRGVTRRIVSNLDTARRVAIEELGTSAIDLAGWGNRMVADGSVPRRMPVQWGA